MLLFVRRHLQMHVKKNKEKVQKKQSSSSEYAEIAQKQIKNRRFNCDICLKEFMRNRDMIRHQQNKHGADALFICDFCNMKFTRKSSIK